jgi:Alw26I/Eco31I/Esp3I family type II restriction m6 adenine DNA methyltransferase
MHFIQLSPKKSINKAFLKEKLSRADIDLFKKTTQTFLTHTATNTGDEEHLKTQVIYWLRDTWFKESFQINPIGKNDLVIHTGKNTSDQVGVLVEVKSKENKSEMITVAKPNEKAFHELVLYYFRQRIDVGNNEIKFLIATNIDEWFIFDANEFDRKIYRNTVIKKIYELKKSDHKDNPWFYQELKKALANQPELKIEVTYTNIQDAKQQVFSSLNTEDNNLIALYKLFSPVHLLKRPFANDSNSLQPKFYTELLHIIGLVEIKDGGKKLILRKEKGERNNGSLLENTINVLDTHDKLSRIEKAFSYGTKHEDRLFHVALELVITWVNRILFLKLLEAQLAIYHKSDKSYRFLNIEKIKDFDDLDKLFFSVLARKPGERREEIQQLFSKVPYLNSSLFEPTELEHQGFFINALEDRISMPVHGSTVLKDTSGKIFKGQLNTIDYLFAFLDAYDFSNEGYDEIQEDTKTLINASVLGLIFEKINGYKDGSFFTPGFITMYMCRETIRNAAIAKFNEVKGWNVSSLEELYDKIDNRPEANQIINSLKICDPAVGSGHFLVSTLNEIISIKNDLKILCDRKGIRLKEYVVEVENDELIITDDDGQLFQYNPTNPESQRVQEAIFHEKQTIIENCLFGVDINPNSVKICRLRLWIELLKHTYYKPTGNGKTGGELETLPNIDINIKTGNSLISRFPLNADIKQALKEAGENKQGTINEYRQVVSEYKNASDKQAKQRLIELIEKFKRNFRTEINKRSKEVTDLAKAEKEFFLKYDSNQLFAEKLTKAQIKHRDELKSTIQRLNQTIEDIKTNKIYENAFEWRFEFPEVLNDAGDFLGFDVVIGNPPYAVIEKERNNILEPYKDILDYCEKSRRYAEVEGGKLNLYRLFIKLAVEISASRSNFGFIVPLTLIADNSLVGTRKFLLGHLSNGKFDCFPQKDNALKRVFEDAKQSTVIITGVLSKQNSIDNQFTVNTYPGKSFTDEHRSYQFRLHEIEEIDKEILPIPLVSEPEWKLLRKLHSGTKSFKDEPDIFVRRGEINQTIYRRFITKEPSHKTLMKGVQVGQYQIKQKLSQGEKEYLDEQAFTHAGFKNPLKDTLRIVTQRITGVDEKLRIVATLVDFESYFADSTNSIHLSGSQLPYDIDFVLGLLNSKLYQWRFKKTSTNNNVSTTELLSLPFRFTPDIASQISQRVGLMLNTEDTPNIKAEIDELVCQLFDLTDDDKLIIGQ